MYEAYYGLETKPFSLLPDPMFLFLSKKHEAALTVLQYGLLNQAGFTVITGEIGSGKTTLIRQLLDEVDNDVTVGLVSNTHRTYGELLQWVLLAFNLEYRDKSKVELYQTLADFILKEYNQNRRTVLIIDEAQNLDSEALEELRMLSNMNVESNQILQLILVGQPGLRDMLKRPDLRQFAQRIAADYNLEQLDLEETWRYIRHRLKVAGGNPDLFDTKASAAVYYYASGIPRLINVLCDTALVFGFGEQKRQIDVDVILQVAHAKQKGGIFPVRDDMDGDDRKRAGGRVAREAASAARES